MKRRVAITGANGFLGAALARRLLADGAEVHALTRRQLAFPGVHWHDYDLAGPAPAILAQVDVIIHAAFAMDQSGLALETLNEAAALQLHQTARNHGIHFIFISSMSAHAGAVSSYGRAKWKIEQSLDLSGATIVRPGLIIGPGGIYARMLAAVRRAPFLPLFYGGSQPVQLISRDDLVEGLHRIIATRATGAFNLGSREAITLREFYRQVLRATGLQRPIIPLPGDLTVALLRMTERLGLRLPLTVENLLGQKYLRAFDTADDLTCLGLNLPPLDALPWTSTLPPTLHEFSQ